MPSGILEVATPWINYHLEMLPIVSHGVDTCRRLVSGCQGLPIEQMYNNDKRPLGAVAESAYEILLEQCEIEDGFPRTDAHAELLEADFTEVDAEYALDRLLKRGYLYVVEERLFVTEHELNEN